MKQVFSDFDEIEHVIDLIEDQWQVPKDGGHGMPTAEYLSELLRNELLEDGRTTPEQIVDVNEIVYWYLDKKVSPGMWQYAFADCLARLLSDFKEPIGTTDDVHEKLDRRNQLNELRDKCVKVLHTDLSRIRAANIKKLLPSAGTGEKVKTGGKRGHEKVYGTEEKKEADRKQWQEWLDIETANNPKLGIGKLRKIVEKKYPVSIHQLKRYTKDPRKNN